MVPVLDLHPRRPKTTTVIRTFLYADFLIAVAIVGIEAVLIAALVGPGAAGTDSFIDDDAGRDYRVGG